MAFERAVLQNYYNYTIAQLTSMQLHLTKDRMGALRPADDQATEALKHIKAGEYLKVDIVRPRGGAHHRLFFALLQTVHSNMTEELRHKYPTIDRLLLEIKLQTGYFDQAVSLGGKAYFIPKSISFARMDQGEFEEFFGKAITVCRKYFLPGTTEKELRDSIDAELSRYG